MDSSPSFRTTDSDRPADPALLAVKQLFAKWRGVQTDDVRPLPVSGSSRKYFRICEGTESVIAAFNVDIQENEAFFYLTAHFRNLGLPVPQIHAISDCRSAYLLEDLGDLSLFNILERSRGQVEHENLIRPWYHQVIRDLIAFQTRGAHNLDFTRCYPVTAFNREAILWDLNYFKYYFLRLAGLQFNEASLQQGFDQLIETILQQPAGYFMYRDFQSRNIMVKGDQCYYIDYQGGRNGPLTYDLASLLYNTKADLSPAFREEMLEYYIHSNDVLKAEQADSFRRQFPTMALVRVLQAMGAYGYRGYFERKSMFLSGIPYGLKNLSSLLAHPDIVLHAALRDVLERLIASNELQTLGQPEFTLWVQSFSYRNGIPSDPGGHGGGFVFDCRALPNPGRDPAFAAMTGKDQPIREFLGGQPEVEGFIAHTLALVQASVEQYKARGFDSISVSYGCTGGRHRSVYCATRLAEALKGNPGISIRLRHLQQGDLAL
ncbi:MAG: phosphotransferase [Bacteroidales bacterium]|nr:phosphotransferase [Bacteroidales bacterium]